MGFNTAIMYLMPNIQLCPASKRAGCFNPCLVSAGRGVFNSVKQARVNRTKLLSECPELFVGALMQELTTLSAKFGSTLVVRLNGTSDIDWSRVRILSPKTGLVGTIFEHYPHVQFYDYTKVYNRTNRKFPNYDLTLSYSGANQSYANAVLKQAIDTQTRIAVVFRGDLPETFKGLPVINGDETDLRHLDEKRAVVVGLKAKGKARKDNSGFVIDTN